MRKMISFAVCIAVAVLFSYALADDELSFLTGCHVNLGDTYSEALDSLKADGFIVDDGHDFGVLYVSPDETLGVWPDESLLGESTWGADFYFTDDDVVAGFASYASGETGEFEEVRQQLDDLFGLPFAVESDRLLLQPQTLGSSETSLAYLNEDFQSIVTYEMNGAEIVRTQTLERYAAYNVEINHRNTLLELALYRNDKAETENGETKLTSNSGIELCGSWLMDGEWEKISALVGKEIQMASATEPAEAVSDSNGAAEKEVDVSLLLQEAPEITCVRQGEEADFKYAVTDDNLVWIIGYTGNETDFQIPDQIENLPVAGIADDAFRSAKISRIQLPDTIIYIGKMAFAYSGISRINIPDSVSYIGEGVFAGCSVEIAIKGKHPHYSVLDNGFYHKDTKKLLAAFDGIEKVPEGILVIGERAFEGKKGLPYDLLPETILEIGSYAFYRASFNGGLQLPTGLTAVGEYAFANADCQAKRDLDSVSNGFLSSHALHVMTESERIIAESFAKTNAILEQMSSGNAGAASGRVGSRYDYKAMFRLPALTVLGPHAFDHFSLKRPAFNKASGDGLSSQTADFSISKIQVSSISPYCFANIDIPGLDTLNLPPVSSVEEYAFAGLSASVTLPATVKSVGDHAFEGSGTVNLGSVQTIGAYSFNGRIAKTLPETLTEIGDGAFESSRISEIAVPDSVDKLGKNVFQPQITLHVSEGSYAQNWAQENGYWFEPLSSSDEDEEEEDRSWLD